MKINELPILFSTEMVTAILEGRKVMTRRIIPESFNGCLTNGGPHPCPNAPIVFHPGEKFEFNGEEIIVDYPQVRALFHCSTLDSEAKCKQGKVGDHLWVRETFQYLGTDGNLIGFKDGGYSEIIYKQRNQDFNHLKEWKWMPSIFMPKFAARIWLEVVDIKVERLHDISPEDAIREGYPFDMPFADSKQTYIDWFFNLWARINGQESLEQNPWVWAISFKVLSTNGKPVTLR